MGGGLLNIVSHGASSIFVFGNPQKSMFYKTYKSITNFGMQRFRLECDKKMSLNVADETKFSFKVERHADMLGDTHLVVNLPDIWFYNDGNDVIKMKWVDELGATMIEEIVIESGGTILSKYSGEYISLVEHRDNANKLALWYDMIGCTDELTKINKAVVPGGKYPNIRGRKLYIPLNCWFTRGVDQALPLVSLQYSFVYIHIRIRPLKQLYHVNVGNENNWVAPKLENSNHRFSKFLNFTNENTDNDFDWDVHLLSTYYFLDDKERNVIAKKENKYLMKDVYQYTYHNLHGNSAFNLESRGLVIGYQFRCRRSDVYKRNEWTNYTNFQYKSDEYSNIALSTPEQNYYIYEEIIKNFRLIIDGNDRENTLDVGVMKYIEPYTRSKSIGKKGVYHYNFTVNTDLNEYQPYGAMNMDKFEEINIHIQTIEPPINTENKTTVCNINPITGFEEIVQTSQDIFKYTFDLEVFEERYNIVVIKNGIIGTLFAR